MTVTYTAQDGHTIRVSGTDVEVRNADDDTISSTTVTPAYAAVLAEYLLAVNPEA